MWRAPPRPGTMNLGDARPHTTHTTNVSGTRTANQQQKANKSIIKRGGGRNRLSAALGSVRARRALLGARNTPEQTAKTRFDAAPHKTRRSASPPPPSPPPRFLLVCSELRLAAAPEIKSAAVAPNDRAADGATDNATSLPPFGAACSF